MKLAERMGSVEKKVDSMENRLGSVEKKMDAMTSTLDRVVVTLVSVEASVQDIKEHMATKEELRALEGRMLDHIDGFAKGQLTMESEVAALHTRVTRVEDRIERA